MVKILPVSIRSLESIIRLSYAFAKLRLSRTVETKDAVSALYLYLQAFYGGYENVDKDFFSGYESLIKEEKEEAFTQRSVAVKQEELGGSLRANRESRSAKRSANLSPGSTPRALRNSRSVSSEFSTICRTRKELESTSSPSSRSGSTCSRATERTSSRTCSSTPTRPSRALFRSWRK